MKWRWTTDGLYSANSVYKIMLSGGGIKWRYMATWECRAPIKVKKICFLGSQREDPDTRSNGKERYVVRHEMCFVHLMPLRNCSTPSIFMLLCNERVELCVYTSRVLAHGVARVGTGNMGCVLAGLENKWGTK